MGIHRHPIIGGDITIITLTLIIVPIPTIITLFLGAKKRVGSLSLMANHPLHLPHRLLMEGAGLRSDGKQGDVL